MRFVVKDFTDGSYYCPVNHADSLSDAEKFEDYEQALRARALFVTRYGIVPNNVRVLRLKARPKCTCCGGVK